MKNMWKWALILGLGIAFGAACSAGGEDDDDPPPPTYDYYAYVANENSDNISAYAINATTGALTALAGSPFTAGERPPPDRLV